MMPTNRISRMPSRKDGNFLYNKNEVITKNNLQLTYMIELKLAIKIVIEIQFICLKS